MQAILDCCCGLDVHKERVFACILSGSPEAEPRAFEADFGTTQEELRKMCAWLVAHGCHYVAMESTGVYWRPIYQVCEGNPDDFHCVMVVNAYHMHNLPGRKSDVKDAQWIATLFRHGLLEPSFVPSRDIRGLRGLCRLYRTFVEERAGYSNRPEKLLQSSGFKLSSVLSDILSKSGRRLLEKLCVHGSLSMADVAGAIDRRVRRSPDEIAEAMMGIMDNTERLILRTLLDKIDDCDARIATLKGQMIETAKAYQTQLEQLDSIPGIDIVVALAIIAEISATPHNYFPSAKNLVSWAGFAPRNDESAGKIKSRKINKGNPYIKSMLCQAAWAAVRVRNSYFHEWFWSHQGKLGKKKAIIAVARKILELSFALLKSGEFYDPVLALSPIQSPSR